MAIIWLVIAVALIAVELHHLAFFALFGALGAGAAAVVALFAPGAIALQMVVAVGVSAAGVAFMRPYVSRAFAHRGSALRVGGVHGGLVAAEGVTIDEVAVGRVGHVRILGENWLAVPWDDQPIAPDTPVVVTDVTGTTLTIRPANLQWELP
jgi:membrane protein implicated in regulation of membrane protease activity